MSCARRHSTNVCPGNRVRYILSELYRCDLFVPLLSKNFLESKWAPQEVGFIASRPEVAIAPLSIDGTIPFGFLSNVQSSPILDNGITRELLVEPLVRRVPRKILPGLIRIAGEAGNYRYAEQTMLALAQYFSLFTEEEAQALAEASVSNRQIWMHRCVKLSTFPSSFLFREVTSSPKRCVLFSIRSRTNNGTRLTAPVRRHPPPGLPSTFAVFALITA